MSDAIRAMAARRVVLELDGMSDVRVFRGHVYREAGDETLVIDVYAPAHAAPYPAVVFVMGYSDAGMRAFFGCNAKDMGSYDSWARLVAVNGMAAVTYTCREPASDARAVLKHVRDHADALGIDRDRLAIWSCSGNVPNALAALAAEGASIRAAALLYGYMLDLDGATDVSDAASTFRFANPGVAGGVAALSDVPLLVVRASADEMPGLNASIDRTAAALADAGQHVTVVPVPGPHAFDTVDPSDASTAAIHQVLAFLATTLSA